VQNSTILTASSMLTDSLLALGLSSLR